MAMTMTRSASAISLDYEPSSINTAMDADICSMFGSLNLRGWAPELSKKDECLTPLQPHISEIVREDSGSDTSSGSEDAAMMEVTDNQGNIQFISATHDESPLGCGLVHILACHYTPSACGPSASSIMQDSDFNFLETILAHREAFVAFPYGHRTCSAALTNLAYTLERQLRSQELQQEGQQLQRDQNSASTGPSVFNLGDYSTVHALHNEAWLMSGWYSH